MKLGAAWAILAGLGAAAGAWAQPVWLSPRQATVVSGGLCRFQVRAESGPVAPPEGAVWRWTVPDGSPGSVDEATGVFTAPRVAQACLSRVRAERRGSPEVRAEAKVVVLPLEGEVFDLVTQVLGPDWVTPFSAGLPFRDIQTGKRFPGDGRKVVEGLGGPARYEAGTVVAGYGLPARLEWRPWDRSLGTLLSYRVGDQVFQQDVTAQDSERVVLRGWPGLCVLESLRPSRRCLGWVLHSRLRRVDLRLRGLAPVAGDPLGPGGHGDGRGPEARFRQPMGLAPRQRPAGEGGGTEWLLADAGNHVVQALDGTGRVRTVGGRPGEAGHRDDPASWAVRWAIAGLDWALGRSWVSDALFDTPTFLAPDPDGIGVLVADSGNHVVRYLDGDNRVSTFAGRPGEPGREGGHRLEQARLHTPMGLAMAPGGSLLVADQGNHVIWRIDPLGSVEVLSGQGDPGDQDGPSAVARFTRLKGLVVDQRRWQGLASAYVVDGHAIRRVDRYTGQVTTVVGSVTTPGSREVTGGDRAARSQALREPCLRDPWTLVPTSRGFLIADRGNHALREWRVGERTLVTVVGAPGPATTRWGLLRDGLDLPLDEAFAAVEAPTGLAAARFGEDAESGCLVVTGRAVAYLGLERFPVRSLGSPRLAVGFPGGEDTCRVEFRADLAGAGTREPERPLYYTVDFLEPDGTLAARCQGAGATHQALAAEGTFAQRGRGRVVVRCVTDQGVASGAATEVTIR